MDGHSLPGLCKSVECFPDLPVLENKCCDCSF